jgi:mRNA interferase MazF
MEVVRRGDVWLATLDPTVSSEIRKTRPCLIVSPDDMNGVLSTYTGLPLTSGSRPMPFRVAVTFQGRDGLILTDQIRTLARGKLIKRLGKVTANELGAALQILGDMFRF